MARPTLPINLTPEQRDLLERLARIPGLDRVRTTFVLSSPKAGAALPIGGPVD